MALTTTLEFGDNTIQRYSRSYMVADCRCVYDRPYNEFRPTGAAHCDRVELTVVAPGKDDHNLYDWYDSQAMQSGRISISMSTALGSSADATQEIYFENAVCFSLSELYDIDSSYRRLIKLCIESEEIKIGDVTFKRF